MTRFPKIGGILLSHFKDHCFKRFSKKCSTWYEIPKNHPIFHSEVFHHNNFSYQSCPSPQTLMPHKKEKLNYFQQTRLDSSWLIFLLHEKHIFWEKNMAWWSHFCMSPFPFLDVVTKELLASPARYKVWFNDKCQTLLWPEKIETIWNQSKQGC